MKNNQHIRKRDSHENKMEAPNYQGVVPKSKLSIGSVVNKYPVVLDDGRTIIYISDKKREAEIRLRYSAREH
ncbi:MAG: hypothetical protein M0Q38_09395 [Bacteroidales bacterium]|jgi:hypothetical protein|nr:hypothetical protein [Bacteroidales bacterium]